MFRKIFFLIITIIFISSCKEPENEIIKYNFPNSGIFICNEGNFTYGNSSLSYFDLSENKIYNQIFYEANNYPLGDVAQNLTIYGNFAFITINNSGKIYIIDKNTFRYKSEIKNLTSPRNICIINSEKAYISDLYSPIITIFNPETYEITGSIQMETSSENFVIKDNYVYVNSWSFNDKVFKINTQTDEIIDSLEVTYQPNSMLIDKNNYLWVLSDGGNEGDENQDIPALTKVDLSEFKIESILLFQDVNSSPSRLCTNKNKDTLYFINNNWGNETSQKSGIFRINISESEIPSEPFILEGEKSFYGLFINPENSEILASDALGYNENGLIYIFSTSGIEKDVFTAGIIPGNFTYKQ